MSVRLWCWSLSLACRYELFKDAIVGWGSFLVSVKLMNGTVALPHNYSLSPDEVVVVDVSLNTTLEQIKLVINRCWATPTQNPGDTYGYIFMENRSAPSHVLLLFLLLILLARNKTRQMCVPVPGLLLRSCSLNTYTRVLTNGNSSTSRVSVQIFSFVDLSVIYLHCQVQICVQIGSDSCVPVSASITPHEGPIWAHDPEHTAISWIMPFFKFFFYF